MKQFYYKVDEYLLKKYPRLWVLGIHIFIPIVLVAWLALIIIGAISVNSSVSNLRDIDDRFSEIAVGMILPVILLVILFFIRQIKFNSIRIHQKLPYQNRFFVFLCFWMVLFVISSLPMVVYFGSWFAPGLEHNRIKYSNDVDIIENYYAHFKFQGCIETTALEHSIEHVETIESHNSGQCVYRLDHTRDSLIMQRYSWGSISYYNGQNIKISVDSALVEIQSFVHVAKKYGAEFDTEVARNILDQNLSYLKTKWTANNSESYFSHIKNVEVFEANIDFNRSFYDRDSIFRMFRGEFWRYYSLLAFSFGFLLIILCSVDRAEFGWAMLVCALLPTVYGILIGLLALLGGINDSSGPKMLLILFVAGAVFVAFGSNLKPTVKRAFAISLNIFLPIVLPTIFLDKSLDQDSYISTSVIIGLILTFVFSFYYRYQYLFPRKE